MTEMHYEGQFWWRAPDFRTAGADVSVEQALQWAFGVEWAELTLPSNRPLTSRAGVSQEYRMMQEAKLGTTIDRSGGRSRPAEDADRVATALTDAVWKGFPPALLAKAAECARTGTRPDWLEGVEPRLEPSGWTGGRTRKPKTKLLRAYHEERRYPHPKNPARTVVRRVKVEERVTPVVWNIHPDDVTQARLDYCRWREVLAWVRDTLQARGLERLRISNKLPKAEPWKSVKEKPA